MTILHRSAGLAVAVLATTAARAADAPAVRPFAAAGAPAASPTPGLGSLTQVALSLALVLALVFALAWLMRRLRVARHPGAPGIDVLAEVSLGPKERAVLIQVDRARLLVGVAAGQVSTLHVLPEAEPLRSTGAAATAAATSAPRAPGFAELLRRSVGR